MHFNRSLFYFLALLISSALLTIPACQQSSQKIYLGTEKPYATAKKNLNMMVKDLKASMISYMRTVQPFYTMDDINSCEKILNRYLTNMHASKSKEEGMKIVNTAVLSLNKLNIETKQTLIETSEREQIAEIIILASSRKGYNTMDEDITEELREW